MWELEKMPPQEVFGNPDTGKRELKGEEWSPGIGEKSTDIVDSNGKVVATVRAPSTVSDEDFEDMVQARADELESRQESRRQPTFLEALGSKAFGLLSPETRQTLKGLYNDGKVVYKELEGIGKATGQVVQEEAEGLIHVAQQGARAIDFAVRNPEVAGRALVREAEDTGRQVVKGINKAAHLTQEAIAYIRDNPELVQRGAGFMADILLGKGIDFDKYFLVGLGMGFQVNGGITWALPIRTAGGILCYVKRSSKDTLNVVVRGNFIGALDTGVGGSFILGQSSKKGKSMKRGYGVGGEIGASAMAGIKYTGLLELNIPFTAFAGFMNSLIKDVLVVPRVLEILSGKMPDNETSKRFIELLKPEHLVKAEGKVGAFAQLNAFLGAGIRKPTENANLKQKGGIAAGASFWGPTGQRKYEGERLDLFTTKNNVIFSKAGILSQMMDVVGLFSSGKLGVNAEAGIGWERLEKGKKRFKLHMEAGFEAMIQIPFLSQFLPKLPDGAQVGAEIGITLDDNNKLSDIDLQIYTSSGDDVAYEGAASKKTMKFSFPKAIGIAKILGDLALGTKKIESLKVKDFTDAIKGVSWTERIPLLGGSPMFGLGRFIGGQKEFARTLGNTEKLWKNKGGLVDAFGIAPGIFLDLEAKMTAEDVRKIINQAISFGIDAASIVANGKLDSINGIYKVLEKIFTHGKVGKLVDSVLTYFILDKALLRIQLFAGTGVSGGIAKGGKIAGDISFQVGAFYEKNLLQGGKQSLKALLAAIAGRLEEFLNQLKEHLGIQQTPDAPA